MASIQSPRTPISSSFKKTVNLSDWWLTVSEGDGGEKRLAVAGMASHGCKQAARLFLSAPITVCHDAHTLETADGITVIVSGLINRSRTDQNGFPPEACNKFMTGFPCNWEVYADQYLGKESTRSVQRSALLADDANFAPISLREMLTGGVIGNLFSSNSSSNNTLAITTDITWKCSGNALKKHTAKNNFSVTSVEKVSLPEPNPVKDEIAIHDVKYANSGVPEENKSMLSSEGQSALEGEVPRKSPFKKKLKNPDNKVAEKKLRVGTEGIIEEHMSDEPDGGHLRVSEKPGNLDHNDMEDSSFHTCSDRISSVPVAARMNVVKEKPTKCSATRRSSRLENLKNKGNEKSDESTKSETKSMSVGYDSVTYEMSMAQNKSPGTRNLNETPSELLSVERDKGLLGHDSKPGHDVCKSMHSAAKLEFKDTLQSGSDVKNATPSKGEVAVSKESGSLSKSARRSSDRINKLKTNLKV